MKIGDIRIWLTFFFAISAFSYVILITSNYHLGVSPDSVYYLEISQNILEKKGIVGENPAGKPELDTHWPPLYPLTLALSNNIIDNRFEAAKYLSAVLFFLTIIIANLIFVKLSKSLVGLLLFNIILLTSEAFSVFRMMWTEPFFLFLLLTVCYFIISWMESKKRNDLLFAGIFSGLLILTRYAGIGFTVAIAIFIIYKKETLKGLLLNMVTFAAPAFIILSAWVVYALNQTVNSTSRELELHFISFRHIKSLYTTLYDWMNPEDILIIGIIIPVMFLIILFYSPAKRKKNKMNSKKDMFSFLIFIVLFYILFLFLSISIFDYYTQLDNRILSPIFPIVLLSILILEKLIIEKRLKYAGYTTALLIACSSVYNFYNASKEFYMEGNGYTGKNWVNSELIDYIKSRFEGNMIYSNGNDLIKLYTNENAILFPRIMNPYTQIENRDYNHEMDSLLETIKDNNGIVVYFDKVTWRYYLPDRKAIEDKFDGLTFIELNDGFIVYRAEPGKDI